MFILSRGKSKKKIRNFVTHFYFRFAMRVIFNALSGLASKSNNDIVMDIVTSLSIFRNKVTLWKCKAHQGLRGNEIADRLAKLGSV